MNLRSKLYSMLNDMLWRELLLPFTSTKRLYIGSSLTLELSRTLASVIGDLVLNLLPELQELEVPIKINQANFYSMFVQARESVGRPVRLLLDEGGRKRDVIRKTMAAVAALAPPRSLPV